MAHSVEGNRSVVLFGGASIQSGGVPVGGRAAHRHPLALLALLIVAGARPLSRDKLIALLWPERDGESARNLLKVAVHELRKELGDGFVRSTGGQLVAELTAISCDVADFLAAILRGDDRAACELYAGPFLDGFFLRDAADFDRWAETERARLAEMYASALRRLAEAAEARGDLEAALKWRRAHSEHDPYHSDVAQRLVVALASSGDRAGAIRAAQSFAHRRKEDLGLTDEHDFVSQAREVTRNFSVPAAATRSLPPAGTLIVPAAATGGFAKRWRRPAVLVLVVAAAAIVVTTVMARNSVRAEASTVTNLVASVPLGISGPDSSWREAFAELLAARFTDEDGEGPRSIDARKVIAARQRAEAGGGALSLDGAMSMARSLGADQLLTSEVVSGSDSITVSARLYALPSGVLRASAQTGAVRGTSLARIADRVFIELLARNAGEPDDRLAGLVNRPIGAARAYVAAQVAYRSARYENAERLYARALDADTTFGAAGLGLAMANSWTTISDNYGKGKDVALRYMPSMSVRDRLFATAFFGSDPALGPAQPAPVHLARWEDLVEKYPTWPEAWYQLGDRYYHYGGLSGLADATERARHAFRTALAQDSLFAAPLHHLVEIYAALGERTELRMAGARYFAATPGVSPERSAIGWEMATALGDANLLARIRANFDSMPREDLARIAWVSDLNGWPSADAARAVALLDRKAGTASEHEKAAITAFALHLNRGQVKDAHADAAALGAQFPDRPIGALWDSYLASFGDGDAAAAADAARRLENFARAPSSGDHVRRDQHNLAVCMVGYWRATVGDLAGTSSAAARLSAALQHEDNNFARRNVAVCRAMLTATIASASPGAKVVARREVAALDTLLLRDRVPPHVILEAGAIVAARLHAALGDTALALIASRRREHLTGDPLFLATQLRNEAIYAKAMGDSAGAARATAHLKALRATER
jgi:DNA-binding SARP family transcriptional activator